MVKSVDLDRIGVEKSNVKQIDQLCTYPRSYRRVIFFFETRPLIEERIKANKKYLMKALEDTVNILFQSRMWPKQWNKWDGIIINIWV